MPAAETVAPIAEGDGFDPFEADDDADGVAARDSGARISDIEEAFDEPLVQQSPRVAIAPAVEDQVESPEGAVDEEIAHPALDRDAPGGVAPTPFDAEEETVEPESNLEEAFPEPGRDDETDREEGDPRMQQAPGEGFNIRPLDALPELTPEQREERRLDMEKERIQAEEDCREVVAAVRADDIKSVSLDIRMEGEPGEDYPFDCGLGREMFQPRSWAQVTYLWKAAGLCHKPLYFEQVALERYGHSLPPAVQPIVSGAHFFGTLPILPYKMGLTTPNECIYTLGYYRPGSCAPYMIPAVPFTWRAAAFEAGAWTGGAFIFP